MGVKKLRHVAGILFWVGIVSFFSFQQQVWADTLYVTDMLILTLREGPKNESQVLRTLKSNAAVEILEEQEQYAKVRTENGDEGWVSKKYLTDDTPKAILLERMKKELDALNRKLEKLEKGRMSLRDQLDDSSKEYVLKMERLEKEIENCKNKVGGTTQELQQVTEKYNALANSSKDIIALVGERDQLQEINQSLKEENDLLTVKMEDVSAENVRLARKEILHWFLAGSGVFFLGLIIGKLSRKKKRY